jgi:chemotaxis protein methyltransferase CheR
MKEAERLTPEQFKLFQQFIYGRCGIRIDPSKLTLVSNRIRRRLRPADCADFGSYYQFLISPAGAAEVGDFLDAITTNETSFFRTPSSFEWLKQDYLNELLHDKSQGQRLPSLRIWSAACSSGEEPYSIAICLAEAGISLRSWSIQILGTDISESSLGKAREAVYKQRSMLEMDEARVRRYFAEDSAGDFHLRSSIKEMVQFKYHNLIKPNLEKPFDCIWLRNVLIYFDRESKVKVIDNLVRSLVSGGYLVVGPSEGVYDMLGMLHKRGTFLYQKP